jgi:hypothetical protein
MKAIVNGVAVLTAARFYVHDLGGLKREDAENPRGSTSSLGRPWRSVGAGVSGDQASMRVRDSRADERTARGA